MPEEMRTGQYMEYGEFYLMRTPSGYYSIYTKLDDRCIRPRIPTFKQAVDTLYAIASGESGEEIIRSDIGGYSQYGHGFRAIGKLKSWPEPAWERWKRESAKGFPEEDVIPRSPEDTLGVSERAPRDIVDAAYKRYVEKVKDLKVASYEDREQYMKPYNIAKQAIYAKRGWQSKPVTEEEK